MYLSGDLAAVRDVAHRAAIEAPVVAISLDELRDKLAAAFPDAQVHVEDLTGGGDHYAATIVSAAFEGKLPIARHRMVYAALGDAMQSDIHALALTTRTPQETQQS